jgi:hypothetical protein
VLIGNQAYVPSVGVLKNHHNDIAIVGQALTNQGFEVMPPIKDARRSVMLSGVRDLVRRLNAAGAGAIGFIYLGTTRCAQSPAPQPSGTKASSLTTF